jgi:hypothetical protein
MLRTIQLLIRIVFLKLIEITTIIYDPYHPLTAKLWPEDWMGWPAEALSPHEAVEKINAKLGQFGCRLSIGQDRISAVDDRAAAFAYQPYDSQELQWLRTKYNLEALIRTCDSEMTMLARLNDWTRRQWRHGPGKNINFRQFYAGEIIEEGRKGEQFSCQAASMAFCQIISAIGYQARLISLSPGRNGPYHAVSEVWINDLAKWVVFDTDFNFYYTDSSEVPLNALELHRILLGGRFDEIKAIKGLYRPETVDIENVSIKPLLLPFYRYFFIDMRNDWMTNVYFRGHPKRSDQNTLRWKGEGQKRFIDLKPSTSDESELYWPLNQVEVRVSDIENKGDFTKLNLIFKTITPNFERFEIEIDKTGQFSQESSWFEWCLTSGVNKLLVRAVNRFGVTGPPSQFEIFWQGTRSVHPAVK